MARCEVLHKFPKGYLKKDMKCRRTGHPTDFWSIGEGVGTGSRPDPFPSHHATLRVFLEFTDPFGQNSAHTGESPTYGTPKDPVL